MLILTRKGDKAAIYVNMDRVTYMEPLKGGGTCINFGEYTDGYDCISVMESILDIGIEVDD